MKIGLTGGIGCGKSTVTDLFAKAGWQTVQTDAIVRDLLDNDTAVQTALLGRWGGTVVRADGAVDRKAIARLVFDDKHELEWLESLLHPKVRNVWETEISKAPDQHWVVEIPLLFEKKLETRFHSTICIESTPYVVEQRMVLRGYSLNEIRQRRQWQMSLKEKICRSDYVISNSGNLAFLKLQIQRFIKQIQ